MLIFYWTEVVQLYVGLGAALGGLDLRKSVILGLRRLAVPRSAPCVNAVENKHDCYVAAVARYIRIQTASSESKSLQNERYHKLAALAQADERDALMADGRPQGVASNGAVLSGHQ